MKYRIKNYKGNLLESLQRFQKKYSNQKVIEARQDGTTLLITSEASKFDNMPNSMDDLIALRDQLKETAGDIEKIEKIEKMIQRFTLQAIDKRKSIKAAKAAIAAVEKETKFLEDDCKEMTELMESRDEYFFGIADKARHTGILLTKTIKVASQKDAYADLFKKLSDDSFITQHPALQDSAKNLKGLLEAARRTALSLGIISDEPAEPEVTWRANIYDKDDATGKMTKFNEGFMNAVKGVWGKICNWFSNKFFPKYREAEERYTMDLDEYDSYLDGINNACEGFLAANA